MNTALLSILLNSLAQLALKKAAAGIVSLHSLLTNFYAYVAAALYVASIGLWIITLKKIDVSLAFPLQSIGYVFVFIVGIAIFKESWNFVSVFGISLIVFGTILLWLSKQ